MATKPVDVVALIKLTSEFQKNAHCYDGEASRRSLLQQARSLVQMLESPAERISHMAYGESSTFGVCRVLIDLGIFKILVARDAITHVRDMALASKSDPNLLARFMKQIAAEAFIEETGPDMYGPNDITRLLASTGAEGMIKDCILWLPVVYDFSAFFKDNHYMNPTNNRKSLWKHYQQTDLNYFEWVASDEEKVKALHDHMSFKTYGRKWFEDPRIIKEVFEDHSPQDVLLVDVGGSSGHDLLAFHAAYPQKSGRLIVQDLPSVIENLDFETLQSQGIEAMSHDFFYAQPVKGSKAYYLKMVLHNWPDAECRKILSNLKDAMIPGYSRILVNEIVIPETNAHWFETSLDLMMLAMHSSHERRENVWRHLVESVDGLSVRKVWTVEGAIEKIIEIELAEK